MLTRPEAHLARSLAAETRGVEVLVCFGAWIAAEQADLIAQASCFFEVEGGDRRIHAAVQVLKVTAHP